MPSKTKAQKRKSKLKKRPAVGVEAKKKSQENKTKPRAPTQNGKLIQDLMAKRGVKGNYKDYVVIAGTRLIDWIESWDIFNSQGEPMGFDGVVLYHKSRLPDILDEKFTARFWNKKLGRRVTPTQQERNPNAARAKSKHGAS